jgi:CheY-like chemotaxis protein
MQAPPDAFDPTDLMRCARQLTEQAQLYAELSATLLKQAARLRALAEYAIADAEDGDPMIRLADQSSDVPAILIADDDEEGIQLFARALGSKGYDVRIATNTLAASREVEARHLDAIILDLHMPMTDGLTVLRSLRSSCNQTPVAIITADYSLDDATTTELHELNAELRFKPLWVEDIVDLADWLLRPRVP